VRFVRSPLLSSLSGYESVSVGFKARCGDGPGQGSRTTETGIPRTEVPPATMHEGYPVAYGIPDPSCFLRVDPRPRGTVLPAGSDAYTFRPHRPPRRGKLQTRGFDVSYDDVLASPATNLRPRPRIRRGERPRFPLRSGPVTSGPRSELPESFQFPRRGYPVRPDGKITEVRLSVFDSQGKSWSRVSASKDAPRRGRNEVCGTAGDSKGKPPVSSGIYFCRLRNRRNG